MTRVRRRTPSSLFTLRLWAEEVSQAEAEWRGELRLVSSGETHYFRDWQTLLALLRRLLPEAELRDGEREQPGEGK